MDRYARNASGNNRDFGGTCSSWAACRMGQPLQDGKGKLGVKKWLILLNPVCGLIVGIVLGAVLPGSLSGIPMGMRNLGEGMMYLIPYAYWQNHRA